MTLSNCIKEQELNMEITDEVKITLQKKATPKFNGARPLRRLIQRK
jgi:ATP-dependent Clp protease ATP-binding subunit ClpA